MPKNDKFKAGSTRKKRSFIRTITSKICVITSKYRFCHFLVQKIDGSTDKDLKNLSLYKNFERARKINLIEFKRGDKIFEIFLENPHPPLAKTLDMRPERVLKSLGLQ